MCGRWAADLRSAFHASRARETRRVFCRTGTFFVEPQHISPRVDSRALCVHASSLLHECPTDNQTNESQLHPFPESRVHLISYLPPHPTLNAVKQGNVDTRRRPRLLLLYFRRYILLPCGPRCEWWSECSSSWRFSVSLEEKQGLRLESFGRIHSALW